MKALYEREKIKDIGKGSEVSIQYRYGIDTSDTN
jgi:hypothetical protein